jgi:hypothetical protein
VLEVVTESSNSPLGEVEHCRNYLPLRAKCELDPVAFDIVESDNAGSTGILSFLEEVDNLPRNLRCIRGGCTRVGRVPDPDELAAVWDLVVGLELVAGSGVINSTICDSPLRRRMTTECRIGHDLSRAWKPVPPISIKMARNSSGDIRSGLVAGLMICGLINEVLVGEFVGEGASAVGRTND